MAAPAQEEQAIKQFKDFILNYNRLSEICFNDCVWELTTRAVTDKEDKCATNCFDKYLKMNQRISQRFQEFQMVSTENMQARIQAQQGGQGPS